MGRYTTRIATKRAERLRQTAIGVIPITIDHADLFTAADKAMEDRVEQEILDRFGGYDAMVEAIEAESLTERGMTAAEAIAHLSAIDKEKS